MKIAREIADSFIALSDAERSKLAELITEKLTPLVEKVEALLSADTIAEQLAAAGEVRRELERSRERSDGKA